MQTYRSNHNAASNNYKDHYISYNWKDTDIYGSDTTAIVIGQMQRFYILNGNHWENLVDLSFEDCIAYFERNANLINKMSNKYDPKDAQKVIIDYKNFKKKHGYP